MLILLTYQLIISKKNQKINMFRIAQKLAPFSRHCGIKCLVPRSHYAAEVFPTLLRLYDLRSKENSLVKEEHFSIKGPLKEFNVMCDIDRGVLSVSSEQLCYHILPDATVVHGKKSGLASSMHKERLSLGSHKKQDWAEVRKRLDFVELFPIWHALGRGLELPEIALEKIGMFSLLEECRRTLQQPHPEKSLFCFKKLFLAAFEGMFVPRLIDTDHQGIVEEQVGVHSPLYLLKKSAELIRSLFVRIEGNKILLLPHLPPEFFAGRFVHVSVPPFGELDLEWSKKTVRQVVLRSVCDTSFQFDFGSSFKSFRLRKDRQDRGVRLDSTELFKVAKGATYHLDRFES